MQNRITCGTRQPSIRHVSEADLGAPKKVLIVGKGPTFCNECIKEYAKLDYLICSINNAYRASDCRFDCCIFIDWNVTKHFDNSDNVKYIFAKSNPFLKNPTWYLGVHNYEAIKDKLYFYDSNDRIHFNEHESVTMRQSTTEAALQLLALAGFLWFDFIGIDGGSDYNPIFGKRPYKKSFNSQFHYLDEIRKKYSLTYGESYGIKRHSF